MVAAAVAVLLLVAILVAFTGAKGGGKGNTATASGSAALIAADETLLLSSPSSSDSAAAATAALTPCQRSNFTATTLKTATEQSMVALFPRLHGQKKFEASDVIRVGQYCQWDENDRAQHARAGVHEGTKREAGDSRIACLSVHCNCARIVLFFSAADSYYAAVAFQ